MITTCVIAVLALLLVGQLYINVRMAGELRDLRSRQCDPTEDTMLLDLRAAGQGFRWELFGVKFDADDIREGYRQLWAFVKAYPPGRVPPTDVDAFTRMRAVVDRYESRGFDLLAAP
jgi:hypothetical protein